MTSILFDKEKKILICDSREVDTHHILVRDDAVKYAMDENLVMVTAGLASQCETLLQFLRDGNAVWAFNYLKEVPKEDLRCITIHKESGSIVRQLTRAMIKKKPECKRLYEGAGGDFLRHNLSSTDDLQEAYDKTIKDCYTLSGGEMRYYNFDTGVNNMDESIKVELTQTEQDSPVTGLFATATLTPGSELIVEDSQIEDSVSIFDLGY